MVSALVLDNVCKVFGTREAVRGINFEVNRGEVFGLIGPNGAGKTTTLRMICTLLHATSGTIEVYGHDVEKEGNEVRRILSYLPEDAGAYKELTGRRYLSFMANFFADGDDAAALVEKGIEMARLDDRIDSKIDTYSKGMVRRLLIARALMAGPELAVMDEVTSGLDVMNAYQVRGMIRGMADSGVAVLLSSHNMFEVESVCDRVAMINNGEIVMSGTPAELKRDTGSENLEEAFVKAVSAE